MSLQTVVVYMKFPKEVPIVGLRQMAGLGHFTQILHRQHHGRHVFFWNFVCKVHKIISRQLKCETYGIFKSFFNLRVLYCTPNLFCPFDHLPAVATQSYFISYLFIFFDFKPDMKSLCNKQTKLTYTCFPKKVPVCVCSKSDT